MPSSKTGKPRHEVEYRNVRQAEQRTARFAQQLRVALHRLEAPTGDEIHEPTAPTEWTTATISVDWLIDAGAQIAARHPDLEGRASDLRSLLAWEAVKNRMAHELAGAPRRLVTASQLQEELQVRIAGEAIASIWQEKVLEPGQVALALGAKESNREKVSALRKRSWLLGVPRDRGYLYPAFQIDVGRREVYPEVRQVNETLGAAEDPWGVASWWLSTNDRVGARPADLVGSPRAEELIHAAKAVTALVG